MEGPDPDTLTAIDKGVSHDIATNLVGTVRVDTESEFSLSESPD